MTLFNEIYNSKLAIAEFNKISKFIEKNYGIRLPKTKRMMVQNRLYKRLKALNINNFEDYVKFVFSPEGKNEIQQMVNEITTNKTDFFRDAIHYQFLETNILPNTKNLNIWSAACSTGQEPYSIAMLLHDKNIKYSILATDLSTDALEKAKKGIYEDFKINNLTEFHLNKFFKKIEDKHTFYQIKDELKQNIKFQQVNLLQNDYNIQQKFDLIFLMNVLIYFYPDTQTKVLTKIIQYLKPNGYLFLGLSESLLFHSLPLINKGPSIYQKI